MVSQVFLLRETFPTVEANLALSHFDLPEGVLAAAHGARDSGVQLSLSVLSVCSFPYGKMPPTPNGDFDFRKRYFRVSMFRQENASIIE